MLELIRKLLALLGMKSGKQTEIDTGKQTEIGKCTQKLKSLKQKNRDLQDKLEDYKQQIAEKEKLILLKEKEMQSSRGEIQDIVKEEIKALFEELETCRGQRDIIFRNIRTGKTTAAKLEELIQGLETPETGVDIEGLIIELEVIHEDLRDNDKLMNELKQTTYKPREQTTVSIEEKLRKFHEERDAVTPTKVESTSSSVREKSPETPSAESENILEA